MRTSKLFIKKQQAFYLPNRILSNIILLFAAYGLWRIWSFRAS